MKRFIALFLSIVTLLCVFIPSNAVERSEANSNVAAIAENSRLDNEFVETLKTVIHNDGDNYTLRLETYVTGETVIEEVVEGLPLDIVLVMDHSNSMYQCIDCDKAVDPVKIYSASLDINKVYFLSSGNTSTPVYFCKSCNAWYNTRHSESYHGGNYYIPKTYDKDEYLRQFYTRYANVNCGTTCTHADYKHPIYEANLDITQTYYRTANNNNPVVYCTDCGYWYNNSNKTHKDGGAHNSDIYYPFAVAEDARILDQFYGSECVPQYIALETAVNEFLNTVYEDAKGIDGAFGTADDIEHRIAMVSFAGDNAGDNSTNCILSFYDPDSGSYGDDRLTGPKIPYAKVDSDKDDYYEYYHQHALQNVTGFKNREILGTVFNNIELSSATHTYKGLEMAKNILTYDNTYPASDYADGKRNRVVILFSDGVPHDGEAFGKANNALQESYAIKNTIGAEVYAIATFAGADGSDPVNIPAWSGDINKANRFMHLVSSNFLSAKYCNPNNSNALPSDYNLNPDLTDGHSYYMVAEDQSALNQIFNKIYSEINNSKAHISLDTNTVLKDIVSSQFVISGPPSAYSESYSGIVNGIIQWVRDEGMAGAVSYSGNTVTVTDFDYSKYYVDTNGNLSDHEGKKLVLEIPIKPAEGNLGGIEMETNESGSGIYYPDPITGILEPVEEYKVPKADIPTTVTVVKNIVGGELSEFEFNATAQHLSSYDGNDGSDGNHLDQNDAVDSYYFKLKNNDSYIIDNVAVGTNFSIAERVDSADYNVTVVVTDGEGRDITSSALTVSDGVYTIASVVPSMTVTFTNQIKHTDLVIEKVVDGIDVPDQNFIFELTRAGDTSFRMNVIISASDFAEGKASVKIERLLLGDYTVKELTAWSNRYTLTGISADVDKGAQLSGDGITVTLSAADEKLTFTNKRTDDLWLSGDSYAENYFADIGVVRKD